MPAGFWAPNRSATTNSRPPRRRRSLLGRKNRSDNDLQERDIQPQQQFLQEQLQQGQPHTIVLPENVKTILIAGTPECWNLSTSAEDFAPETCDASLMTLGSELSPGSLTIDEDEPFLDNRSRHSTRDNGGLEWLRTKRRSGEAKKKANNRQQHARHFTRVEQSTAKEPSSMVVMYRSPVAHRPSSPQEAIQIWFNSAEALMRSKEMAALATSTRDVIQVAGVIAIKTAFWPVTLPLYMACATKDFVGWTLHQALAQNGTQPQLINGEEQSRTMPKAKNDEDPTPEEGRDQVVNPLEGLLQLVPVVLNTAGKIKDEIGSAAFALVTPPQPREQRTDTENDKEILERLKIPVVTAEGKLDAPPQTAGHLPLATKADFSKYLMRVEDLDVHDAQSGARVLYVDLNSEFRDEALLQTCLDKMYHKGIAIATAHAPGIPPATTVENSHVEWKPEGATARLLRKKTRQTTERWEETIRSEILIWSGNFKKACGGSPIYRQYPMFLARGIIERLSPREFLELLWDDGRTEEYNNYSMGRHNAINIDDKVLSSSDVHYGVKAVRSETRVPFTTLSVGLCTVMHCRALPGGPNEGYVIVSRSLVSGMAGSHTTQCSSVQKAKSEILWGVNVLRMVPGHPGQTELTSVSQVASTMVPQFLSQKIGLMGVEDFFKNVRCSPKVNTSSTTSPPGTDAHSTISI